MLKGTLKPIYFIENSLYVLIGINKKIMVLYKSIEGKFQMNRMMLHTLNFSFIDLNVHIDPLQRFP